MHSYYLPISKNRTLGSIQCVSLLSAHTVANRHICEPFHGTTTGASPAQTHTGPALVMGPCFTQLDQWTVERGMVARGVVGEGAGRRFDGREWDRREGMTSRS